MTSAVRRFFLFFFSIATLASCEDPTDIGIGLQDENLIGTHYMEFELNTGTVLLSDSVNALRVAPALLGQYSDPQLGTVTAKVATEIGLGGTNLKFGDNPQLTSLELTLDYSHIYGDKNKPLTVNVYQLNEGFREDTYYFTNTPVNASPTPLGSATITPALIQKAGAKGDSTVAQNLIRIPLSEVFAKQILQESGKDKLANQDAFLNFLKGLAIVPSGDAESMLALKLTADSTKMVLRYTDGGVNKKHTFTLSQSGSLRFYTNITDNRAGTIVETLTKNGDFIPSEATNGESYVQTNTQLVTKLNFPELEKLKEQLGDVVINRAELVLPVKNSSATGAFAPVPQLVLYETNEKNRILKNAEGTALTVQQDMVYALNSTQFTAPVQYNSTKKHYALNMTTYVQALMYGGKPNKGLLLAPARVTTAGSSGQTLVSPETSPFRSIISNSAAERAKLLIYYSKVSK